MHLPTSRSGRLTSALVTVLLVGGLTAAPAFAHVEAAGAPATGGATAVTFSFTHGCKGSPTTSLRVQLPAGTTAVTADNPTGWTSTVSTTEIDWSGGSIPDNKPGSFVATMTLAGAAGDTVFFPTIQGCAQGEETWIDKSTDPEAEQAAPRIVLDTAETPATGDHDHDKAGGGETGTTEAATGTTEAADHDKAGGQTGSTLAATGTSARAPSTTTDTVVPATTSTSSSSLPIILGILAAIVVVAAIIGLVLRGRATPSTDASGDATGSGSTGSGPSPTT